MASLSFCKCPCECPTRILELTLHPFPAQRTRGDGQENLEVKEKIDLNSAPAPDTSIQGVETASFSSSDSKIAKYLPKGKIYNLVPKLVANVTSSGGPFGKTREPRFVPFEPYKAAVTPLLPSTSAVKQSSRRHTKRASYNSKEARLANTSDVNILARKLATNDIVPGIHALNLQESGSTSDWELMYKDMRKEKEYAEKQLKFQTQVNSELKNLLIAAVGEDLNDRVNVLTEDLARALLDSSNDLSSHSEQIEYLAGQCEVWRSKFLASSLMLEELARWKTTLLEKNRHLVASNKELLRTMAEMRDMQGELLKNLCFLVRDKSQVRLTTANALDLARESLNISQQLALINSAVGVPSDLHLENLDRLTDAEKLAEDALKITEMNLIRTDDPFRAIVNHAFPTMTALKDERAKKLGGEQSLGD